ncbi:tyrosine-type recombinase/integrase [Neorhizobium sp. NCHU2750]|uniref:tyrosine-type recombinase/integrase n=1 Tax=Neorhizobium sp. NCHU2750 TaxID=1825976 RepID=UPI000E72C61B|nr:hypothetical protein NCHU2750_20840 [Neorhizobium sp. NCHU2750]
MAFLHWPTSAHIPLMNNMREGYPFISDVTGNLTSPVNWYIYDRCRGKIDPENLAKPRTKLKELSHNTVKKVGYSICNALTWGETEEAHPNLGVLLWHQIKEWHVTEIYQDALTRGYWTQQFWQDGHEAPLHPQETIYFRINEVLLCYRWMALEGLVDRFEQHPTSRDIILATHDANLSYSSRAEEPDTDRPKKQNFRRTRTIPGNGVLPPMDGLIDWLERVSAESHRPALLHTLEIGLRISETEENTLLPGVMHARKLSHIRRSVSHRKWTSQTRLLKYNLSDDAMIGVLPDRRVSFSDADVISMRVIGKGAKVRLVHMARKTAQAAWHYADSTRIHILNRNNISPLDAPAQLFLNRDGHPLTAAAMIRGISRANENSTDAVKITAHVLRHLFACFYLKNAIEGQAAREGLTMDQLSYEQIEKIAEAPARTLQLHLGHTYFEDTAGYIKLVIEWWLTPKYFTMWNNYLDGQNA